MLRHVRNCRGIIIITITSSTTLPWIMQEICNIKALDDYCVIGICCIPCRLQSEFVFSGNNCLWSEVVHWPSRPSCCTGPWWCIIFIPVPATVWRLMPNCWLKTRRHEPSVQTTSDLCTSFLFSVYFRCETSISEYCAKAVVSWKRT